MDASLFSRLQAGHVAAAHVVGTSLAPKAGATPELRSGASGATTTAKAAAAATAASTTGSSSSTTSAATDASTITSSDFLTLLVSELKNQDPTAPTDPNAYITQLVGVNSLEQLISINTGISSLDTAVTPTSKTGTGSGSGTGGTGGVVPAATSSGTAQTARTTAGTNLA